MKNFLTHNKNIVLLIFIIIVAVFFYTFNLSHTYWFAADSARDTLRSLQILQNKEITLIGPPLSFGQNGIKEIYFGSLIYYLGALGLFLTHNNVLGPIYVNVVIMMISIISFFILAKQYLKDNFKALLATFIFALSPLTVTHIRFFWNPNFIISLAPIFWLFYYLGQQKKNKISFFAMLMSGILGGLLINLHYFVIPVMISVFLFLIFSKQTRIKSLIFLLGIIIGSLPLIIFELKNNFYLFNAIIFNLSNHSTFEQLSIMPWYIKLLNILRVLPILLGLDHDAIFIPVLWQLSYLVKIVFGSILAILLIKNYIKEKVTIRIDFLLFIGISILITILFSQEELYIRYFFIALPILILIIGKLIPNKFSLIIFIILFCLLIDTRILYKRQDNPGKKVDFPTVLQMEEAAKTIQKNRPEGPYNITENYIGDARATYLRFFVEKHLPNNKPEGEKEYENLRQLYVYSPNLQTVYKENRWEFYATPHLKLQTTYKIDNNHYLYKFAIEKKSGQ